MDISLHISEIKEKGVTVIPNLISKQECKKFIDASKSIIDRFVRENKYLIHNDSQYIFSPFQYDKVFLDGIYIPTLDQILKPLIDDDYVLINSNITNRQIRDDIKTGYANPLGDNWHTDSRVVGGQRLDKGFSFLTILMLDDFTVETGATQYVEGTHVRRDTPERYADYSYKSLVGEAGTMAILDTGLWHRRGPSSRNSRWSMINYYGPWFMKPYFRYPEMLGEEFGKSTSKELRRLLHYNSTPPVNEDQRLSTLIKE